MTLQMPVDTATLTKIANALTALSALSVEELASFSRLESNGMAKDAHGYAIVTSKGVGRLIEFGCVPRPTKVEPVKAAAPAGAQA